MQLKGRARDVLPRVPSRVFENTNTFPVAARPHLKVRAHTREPARSNFESACDFYIHVQAELAVVPTDAPSKQELAGGNTKSVIPDSTYQYVVRPKKPVGLSVNSYGCHAPASAI